MENFDKIERYLKQVMPENERTAFEKEVAENEALADELLLQRVEEEAIDLMIEDELLEKVRLIAAAEKKAGKGSVVAIKKSIFKTLWLPLAIAASVLFIIGLFMFNPSGNSLDNKGLALETLAEHRPNLTGSMAVEEEDVAQQQEAKFNAAISTGDSKNIAEAISFFTQQKENDANYKLGHAYLLQPNFPKAIESFQQYLDNTIADGFYKQQADFYLALAYLGNEDVALAKAELTKIAAQSNHIFNKGAKALLQKLNKN